MKRLAALVLLVAGPAAGQTRHTTVPFGPIPFTIDSNDFIRLPVTVGDTITRSFLFDTGAGVDVLPPSLIAALHGVPVGQLDATRMTGERLSIHLYRISRVRVGDLEWHDVLVGAGEFLDRVGLPGILSLQELRDDAVTLDLQRNVLTIEPADRARDHVRTVVAPLAADDLRGKAFDTFADFLIGGQPGQCELDTGSQGPTISTRFLKTLGIDSTSPDVKVRRATTIAGATQVRYITTVPDIALAADTSVRQGPSRVIFSDIIYDCVIGLDWWKGRILTLDLPRHRLLVSSGKAE